MSLPPTVEVWGLPLAPLRLAEAADAAIALARVGGRGPSFLVTANTHYAMLAERREDLREVNRRAAMVLADGAPLVWASRLSGRPLPERVAGSDLIYALTERAAAAGLPVYFLGGAPGVAARAVQRLEARCPGLKVVGVESPPFRPLTAHEQAGQLDRIRAAAPALLILAATMPAGELWLAEHLAATGVPFGVNLGASIDFVAGRVRRAPRWMQRSGLEWSYRLAQEPRRLGGRYLRNGRFVLARLAGSLAGRALGRAPGAPT